LSVDLFHASEMLVGPLAVILKFVGVVGGVRPAVRPPRWH
jgi:hypothetical protein